MYKNRISAIRTKKGFTLLQLAKEIGTDQMSLHAWENGILPIRFHTAVQICKTLSERMETVFPETKKILARVKAKGKDVFSLWPDSEIQTAMGEAGIDMDPTFWTLIVHMRGGRTRKFPITSIEQDRLWAILQHSERRTFATFTSNWKRVALNRKHLFSWQFVFDVDPSDDDALQEEHERGCLEICFVDRAESTYYEVESDSLQFGPEENEGSDSQLQALLSDIEDMDEEEEYIRSFEDLDGERLFFYPSDVALLGISLISVEPTLSDFEPELEDSGQPMTSTVA